MSLRVGLARAGRAVRARPCLVLPTRSHSLNPPLAQGAIRGKKTNASSKKQTPTHSTSKATPLISNEPRPLGLEDGPALAHKFNTAIGMNDPAEMHRWYGAIRSVLIKHPKQTPWLTRHQLLNALTLLAMTHRLFSRNWALIDTILEDFTTLYDFKIDEDCHERILDGIFRSQSGVGLETPHSYLFKLAERPGNMSASVRLWNILLRHCLHRSSPGPMRRIMHDMIITDAHPTLHSYELLFKAIGSSTEDLPTLEQVTEIVDEMISIGLPFDAATWEILCACYNSQGFRALADDVRDLYDEKYGHVIDGRLADTASEQAKAVALVHRALSRCAAKEGVDAAIDLFQRLQKEEENIWATPDVLAAILRSSHRMADLRKTERAIGIKAGPVARVWMLLIKNADIRGFAHDAVRTFETALAAGVPLTASLATPVIHVLLKKVKGQNGHVGSYPASADALDAALRIYDDLCTAHPEGPRTDPKGPTVTIYRTLTRAIVTGPNQEKYFPRLISLYKDMRLRGLPLDSKVFTTIIVAAMRRAPTIESAFGAYRMLTEGSLVLNDLGFIDVIHQLCSTQPGQLKKVPFELVKNVCADARAAGYELSELGYSEWFTHAGKLATSVVHERLRDQTASNIWHETGASVKSVHSQMTIDATVTPTSILWTTLMDAYSRCGMASEAMDVWHQMLLLGKANEASVSVMVDTCSHQVQWFELMQHTWSKLVHARFPLNARNWRNYLEALCRMHRLEPALRVLCGDMVQFPEAEIPDVRSVSIVMKFAHDMRRQADAQKVIQRHLPELWDQYQEHIQEYKKSKLEGLKDVIS